MTQNTIVNERTGPVLANYSVSHSTSSSTCDEYEMLLGELLVVLVEASTVKIPHSGGQASNVSKRCSRIGNSASNAVAPGYAEYVRRLELLATYTIIIFHTTSAHQPISRCAEATPVAPGES